MQLSVVIPAYNERHRLGPMLEAYVRYFDQTYGAEVEWIVVVNGSVDGTEDVVAPYAAANPRVRLMVEPAAVGKGGAILIGARAARGDWVGFVDADGATPPEAFDDLVRHRQAGDCLIASRWLPGAVVEPRQPLARRVASRIFNFWVRWLFRVRISDTQCGAKCIRRAALETVLPRLGITQWAFDVDLLFQLRRAGYRIVERPTVWRDKAGSKVRVVRASIEMTLALVRLRLVYSRARWIVTAYDRLMSGGR